MQVVLKLLFLESSLYTAAVVLGAMLIGLWAGSLAYTIVSRRARGMRVLGEPSSCPECGARLSFVETLPVISWFRLRGQCAHCKAPISLIYPTTELLGAGVCASLVMRHGIGLQTVELLLLAFVLTIVALESLTYYRIPNVCILLAYLIRAAYLGALYLQGERVMPLVTASVFGVCALGMPLLVSLWLSNAVLDRDVVGMGTIKLVTVVGLYLGWQQGLICMAIAFAIGFLVWVVSPHKMLNVEVEGGALEHKEGKALSLPSPRDLHASFEEDIAEPMATIPFAPSIIIALWIMLLIGVAPGLWNTPIF